MTAVPPPFNVTFRYFATSLDDDTKYTLAFPMGYNIVPDSLKDRHSTTFKAIDLTTQKSLLFQTRHPEGLNGYLVLNPDEPVDKWLSTFVEIVDEDYDESEDDYWVCDCEECITARNNNKDDEDEDDFCEDCYYGHCPEHRGDYETDEDEDDDEEEIDLKPQFEIVESFDEELEDFDYDVKSDCSDDSDYEFEDDVDDENDNDYDVEEFDDDDVEEPQDYDDGYPILYWDEDEDEDEDDLYTITTDDGRKISIGPSLRATGVTNKTLKFENGQFVFKFDEEKQEKPKYNFIRTERTLRNKTYTSTIKQKI